MFTYKLENLGLFLIENRNDYQSIEKVLKIPVLCNIQQTTNQIKLHFHQGKHHNAKFII